MEKTTQVTVRLTPAQAYALHAAQVRRNAAIERQRVEIRADIVRLQALYADGSLCRRKTPVAPAFVEATRFTTERLAGGLKASVAADKAAVTRRKRQMDMSPEAEARRAKRREQRAARKARREAAVQLAN
jgi:hypothetical protein